jgi:hypothetical protein
MGRRRKARVATRALRLVRLIWPDGNPLRRKLDRAEAAIVTALTVVFLLAAPLTVTVASHAAYSSGTRSALAERTAWHQVRAVLLGRAVPAAFTGKPEAPARWTAPGGARRTGLVDAPQADAPAGSIVRVWTDRSGQLTGPPITQTQVRGQAALLALLAPVGLGLTLLVAGCLAHYLITRRRLAMWDAEWRATGPRWSRQR